MAVSHVKSNAIADFTGTVTVFNSLGVTQTTQATALVRPSDWNSAHNQFMTIGGNTAGASTLSGTNIVLQGGNNVTLSANASTIVFSGPDLTQYLTTAAQSNHSHGNPTLALTNLNGSTASASNGLTLSLSAAAQSVQTQGSVAVQGSTGAISFANSNGITFGGNASTITASHNGLTTARASNDGVGLNTALTAGPLAWTVNSSGISLNAGSAAGTTTAVTGRASITLNTAGLQFNGTGLAGTGFTSTTTAGTAIVATQNSAGLSMGVPAFLTVAGGGLAVSAAGGSQSTGTVVFSNSNGVSFGFNAGTITATVNPGAAAGIAAIGAGTQTGTSGTMVFANSNGVTFGLSGSTQITASHNGLTTARASNDAIGLNTALTANGVSVTANSSGLSLNFPAFLTTQSGQAFSADASSTFQTLSFQNSNGVSFSNNAGALRVTHDLQFTSNTSAITSNALNTSVSRVANIVAATNSTGGGTASLSSNVSFSNANGVSFFTSAGGAVVGSVQTNYLTTARASTDAVGLNTALTAGPLAWTVNSSGISLNAGSAAGTSTGFAGNLISGSMTHNTAGLNLSLNHPAWLTTARASNDAVGLNTANTNVTWTVNSSGISLNAAGYAGTGTSATNASVTLNSNGLAISVAAPGGGGGAALSAGTQSVSTGTVNFANSNGISFGMSNSNQITASYTVPSTAGLLSAINVSGGTTSNNLSAITFANSNGVTFGLNASTLTASHNGLTTARASNDAVGLNTALTAGPLAWTVNSSGISLNAGSAAGTSSGFTGGASISGSITHNTAGIAISLSHPAWITTAAQSSASNVSAVVAATNNTGGGTATLSGAVSFTNANNATFYTSAGNAIALSLPAYLTTARASNDAIGLNTAQTNVTWTVNSSGISLNAAGYAGTGTSATNASVTLNSNGLAISVAAPGGGGGVALSAGTQSVSTGTVAFSNSNGITFGMSGSNQITASYNSTQFAGTGTTFQGNNASGSMTLNSAGLNLSVSVAAPGAAAENNAIQLLGANTAGNTTATGSTIGWSGQNITLSGTNASQIVISAPATSSLVGASGLSVSTNGSTISVYENPMTGFHPYKNAVLVAGQPGQHTMAFAPLEADRGFQFDRIVLPVLFSNATNSSNSWSLSLSVGIFSKNGSTLSLITSTSTGASGTASGTAGNYSIWGGPKLLTIGFTSTINFTSPLYVGVWSKTSANAGGQTLNLYLASQNNSNFSGIVGVASATSQQLTLGLGHSSATFSSAMPNTMALSLMQGTGSLQIRPVALYFASGTA